MFIHVSADEAPWIENECFTTNECDLLQEEMISFKTWRKKIWLVGMPIR